MNPMVATGYFKRSVSLENIRSHIEALEGERNPVTSPESLEYAADYIADSFSSLGYDLAVHSVPDNGRCYRNIIATRNGSRLPHERVVVLAHYDTVAGTPGADDNASGVAVLLETARVLGPFTGERTVHFIGVTLEENEDANDPDSGTRGSRALAVYARENSWDIKAVVVLESVAYAGETIGQTIPPGVPVPVPEIGNFIAVIGNERSQELVDHFSRVATQQGENLPVVDLVVPGNGELLPDSRRSDHSAFWDEGFKAIMITDTTNFRNPHDHQPTDTLGTLNMDFAAKVCRVTTETIYEMAQFTE